MTYYTILLILFTDGTAFGVVYKDPLLCGDALLTVPYEQEGEVEYAVCRVTDTASGSIRPKARPVR